MSLNKIPVLLVAFFLAGGAFAQASTSVDIRWIGPYTAESTTSIGDASMLLGARSQSEGTKSLESTTLISARIGTRFGVGYVLSGPPTNELLSLKGVWQFPSGGMRNPESGRTADKQEWKLNCRVGNDCWAGFIFDKSWELVPGTWTLEVWQGATSLVNHTFNVLVP